MFTEKCFILKFSENLANKLAELGHNVIRLSEPRYIVCDKNDVYLTNLLPDKDVEEYIDCGTNEDLFLAIAALRNDSDKYQWFICKEEFISTHTLDFVKKSTWQKSIHDKLTYGQKLLWKKANVKELMLYFNHLK